MPFTHHSHSGQFCGHATDNLEDVVKEAIAKGMELLCMTEHMPRDHEEDLYPEEVSAGITPSQLDATFGAYVREARRLQGEYRNQIRILVGMETEWIRPKTCRATIERLLSEYSFDMLVGSVHHVHAIPIDFSQSLYDEAGRVAADKAGASHERGERILASDYFDLQYDMLTTLRPPIVGHFDLVRLLGNFERRGESLKQWPEVWEKVQRNLQAVKHFGGCLEINSAGLRKGLKEPYPCADICKAFLQLGGQFVLSDDSHGISQVATCYDAALRYVQDVGIVRLAVFDTSESRADGRFAAAGLQFRNVEDLWSSRFVSRSDRVI